MTEEVMRPSPRTPYKYGEKVIHNGQIWTVIEDRIKNISLRKGDNHFKAVLPSDVSPIEKEEEQ